MESTEVCLDLRFVVCSHAVLPTSQYESFARLLFMESHLSTQWRERCPESNEHSLVSEHLQTNSDTVKKKNPLNKQTLAKKMMNAIRMNN